VAQAVENGKKKGERGLKIKLKSEAIRERERERKVAERER
jgi:hypothetical protein